jgi:hypothetical protein
LETLCLLKTAEKSLSKSLIFFPILKLQKLIQNLLNFKLVILLLSFGYDQRTFAKVKICSNSFRELNSNLISLILNKVTSFVFIEKPKDYLGSICSFNRPDFLQFDRVLRDVFVGIEIIVKIGGTFDHISKDSPSYSMPCCKVGLLFLLIKLAKTAQDYERLFEDLVVLNSPLFLIEFEQLERLLDNLFLYEKSLVLLTFLHYHGDLIGNVFKHVFRVSIFLPNFKEDFEGFGSELVVELLEGSDDFLFVHYKFDYK